MKDKTKYCYFCDSQINKSVFAKHQEGHAEVLATVRFSNDMKQAVRSKCKICGSIEKINNMRMHTKSKHGMVITEYKEKFNQHHYDLVEKILHRCGVCGEILLLDSDCIAVHLSSKKATHDLTHAQYNAKFMVTKNNDIKNVEGDRKQASSNTEYESNFLNKVEIAEQSPTGEGFQKFLRKLSLPEYPTLLTILEMRDSSKQVLLKTALQACNKQILQ